MNNEKRQRLSLSKKLVQTKVGDLSPGKSSTNAELSKNQQSLLNFTQQASLPKSHCSSGKTESWKSFELDEKAGKCKQKQNLLKRKNDSSDMEKDNHVNSVSPVFIEVSSSQVLPDIAHVRAGHANILSEEDNKTVADDVKEDLNTSFVPYYLDSFLLVVDTVLNDSFYSELFNEEDHVAVQAFTNLSEEAQKLYVRLFLRKHRWITVDKIVYKDIASDFSTILANLCASTLILNESNLTNVDEVVACLSAPCLKSLAKTLQINCISVKKHDLACAIIKHAKQRNVSSFFTGSSGATEKMVLARAKALLGGCYRLDSTKRCVFARMMMLFGIHNSVSDDQNSGQQQMLMTRIGRIKYPEYKVLRHTKIFSDRSSLIRFAKALEREADLQIDLQQKEYEAAYERYINVKNEAESVLVDPGMIRYDELLPQHLRCFTAGAVYARFLTNGVEVLQFTKRYSDAVDQLRWLLRQSVYHIDYRGRWYDRLALNVDYHLKQPKQSLEIIKSALCDKWVRAGRRYNLFLRAKKICQMSVFKKSKLTEELWNDFEHDVLNVVEDPVAVTINARLVPHTLPGSAPMYLGPESSVSNEEGFTVFTRVEDVALRHYMDHGYTQGIHAEGASVRSLFTLFMWDIVFMPDLIDVFYNGFQTSPLDIHTDNFYINRREAIESRLELISNSTAEALCDMAGKVWDNQNGTLCIGMSWEIFRDREHVLGLIKCVGGAAMAGIFRRLAEQHRYVTGGFPDLTVWNPNSGKFKIVEVKGPGDRLSTKQILWLDYLTDVGIDAEVCYVKAVSSKKV